jgi:hypothetical protein
VSASERGGERFDLGKKRHHSWLRGQRPRDYFIVAMSATNDELELFDNFRADLDEHNDRRERLIKVLTLPCVPPQKKVNSRQKASRDVTNLSKKTIFLLHRLMMEDSNISTVDNAPGKRAALRGREKLVEVQTIYARLRQELEGNRFWRYQSQVSPGLQEYIEALGFAHYLEYGSLITFDQVQQTLADSQGVAVSNIDLIYLAYALMFPF